jgi:hypothetical protein
MAGSKWQGLALQVMRLMMVVVVLLLLVVAIGLHHILPVTICLMVRSESRRQFCQTNRKLCSIAPNLLTWSSDYSSKPWEVHVMDC